MGRPARGPVSTFPNELKASILHLCKLHPGWGPDTLLTALKMDPCWADHVLPSRAQLARLLKHAGLTRRYQPHHDLIQPAQTSLTDPHQEWQLDAQGVMRVEGVGKVSLISIVDVTSRLKAESYPSLDTTNPALPDNQLTLRRAFLGYGLPQTFTLDHGVVFMGWMHGATYSIGICPVGFSPTNLRSRPIPKPFTRGNSIEPPWEEEFLTLEKVYTYLAQCRWVRSIRPNGCFELGSYHDYVGNRFARRSVAIGVGSWQRCLALSTRRK